MLLRVRVDGVAWRLKAGCTGSVDERAESPWLLTHGSLIKHIFQRFTACKKRERSPSHYAH